MEHDQEAIRAILKQVLRPADPEPRRDLWPAVLRRLDERPAAAPWYDWAIAAAVVIVMAMFPQFIPVLMYHL